METVRATLRDGTPVVVRPIQPGDAPLLAAGLESLSPESRYRRFLRHIDCLTPEQLRQLAAVDGVNHLALGLGKVLREEPEKVLPIAVARSVRDPDEPDLAEVAVAVADDWQGRGAGSILLRLLAEWAWATGIRRWKGLMLAENTAVRGLMEKVGTLSSQHYEEAGTLEAIYDLHPPTSDGS